ncbi:kinase-like protein [Schizopora paradoxa]|uniref:Kinase-like protein n=1 Tax=Schizopora paradoxa TaxID=27342 RepID=A0A0H2RLV9_9AGAM|nr:kinase-like protein [Schizopora paradoxa]
MLAAASSFFSRTNISQNYNIGNTSPGISSGSRSSTPGPSSNAQGALPSAPLTPAFHVGLWKVQSGTHKVTQKRVSVWSFDKRASEMERVSAQGKEKVIETLKAETSALSRLRHPSVLEMVEPLEETRSELIFATEPLLFSLYLATPNSPRSTATIELDEVEIRKGILQICKGLSFLHTSARLIHSNLRPDCILINSSGDWKLGGLSLTVQMAGTDSTPSGWHPPIYDSHLPGYIQRSFDYLAPEYVLEEKLVPASDMYSLGCLIYSVHNKGDPPYRNRHSAATLRDNVGKRLQGLERGDPELKVLVEALLARNPNDRPTPSSLPSHGFFSSLSISTLNFLDRSTFASKSREEKISFMKGLTGVLDRFSEGLRIRKILPSLVEEMKDTHLLPYILPNVFAIAQILSPTQFGSLVLPSLKPLFAVKEPPQNMLTLLDNLNLLQAKSDKAVFREHVLPLVYNALESEHAVVQERALRVVPDLCESIDYAEVQGVLFPRVALVFTKTTNLSVKVSTLQTFLAMVKTLDQTSLTQKLVPLLSRIRTKEPSVMTATLAVQEAMGLKVDREAVATLVLPQLWALSIGPLLNVQQFQNFMAVIKKLSDRVEREHLQHLRDSHRIEDKSAIASGGGALNGLSAPSSAMDFQSLVAGANTTAVKPDAVFENGKDWQDDVWGSLLNSDVPSPGIQNTSPAPTFATQSLPSSPRGLPPPLAASSSARLPSLSGPSQTRTSPPLSQLRQASFGSMSMLTPSTPTLSNTPLQPNSIHMTQPVTTPTSAPPGKPNYNITLPPTAPMAQPSQLLQPVMPPQMLQNFSAPLQPTQTWAAPTNKKPTQADWGDFDPLL